MLPWQRIRDMPELALALLFVAAMLAAVNWRMGLTPCVLTAVLQDPLRKLTPNEPAYFGDVFVLLIIGWAVGFLLAMPELATRDVALRQQRATRRSAALYDTQAMRR